MNKAMVAHPRSYLFVPGNRPERFAKAFASGADAVIVDLEDAVAPAQKAEARAALASWCARQQSHRAQLIVRINDDASAWFEGDISLLRVLGSCTVMLPKAESARQVERVAAALPPEAGVIALIESASGLLEVDAIAKTHRVQRLAFGTIDYALDLGLNGDPRGLLYPASRIALASRVAALPAPVAGVTPAVHDDVALRSDFGLAMACGFGAKMCIHPSQVDTVHAMLAPSQGDIEWARRVIAAAESGTGAVQVDGKMVDRPVLLKASAILGQAPAVPAP